MNVSVKEITKQALTLPASEREKIASSLLHSTHNSELTDVDREWMSVAVSCRGKGLLIFNQEKTLVFPSLNSLQK